MIKFFADTASISEIEYSFGRDVNDGITTNPKILETTGNLDRGVIDAFKALISRFPDVPVSLEVDLRGVDLNDIHSQSQVICDVLVQQADELSALGSNVVVKIPICEGGLLAVRLLSQKGIKTNVTACMCSFQAIEAAKAGASYVSLFANRMLDAVILEKSGFPLSTIDTDPEWKSHVKNNKNVFGEAAWAQVLADIARTRQVCNDTGSELIVGSIRSPKDISRLVAAGPNIITIPTSIVEGLENIAELKATPPSINATGHNTSTSLIHPLTTSTIIEFEESARRYLNIDA